MIAINIWKLIHRRRGTMPSRIIASMFSRWFYYFRRSYVEMDKSMLVSISFLSSYLKIDDETDNSLSNHVSFVLNFLYSLSNCV